jgi:UDP-glucose 4-epimerase
MKILLTGATGKVGQNLLPSLLQDVRLAGSEVVALCNHRMLPPMDRVQVVRGSLADPQAVAAAMRGVTHVIHMAAVKETPDQAIDVALKGMFLLLEEARQSRIFRQFILIGGDCAVGHVFHGYDAPITEASPRRAYPGCYALTKVLEEVMLEQVQIQYGLNGCILRAPWIMEKDDLRFALSFGPEQFGGPAWDTLMPPEEAAALAGGVAVPLMRDRTGAALKRNFVHVDDLVRAILAALDHPAARQRLFHIAMDRPVDYGELAAILARTRKMRPVEIATPFHSNWLDITAARAALGWHPAVDLEAMIEMAWAWEREEGDPRKVWYPG